MFSECHLKHVKDEDETLIKETIIDFRETQGCTLGELTRRVRTFMKDFQAHCCIVSKMRYVQQYLDEKEKRNGHPRDAPRGCPRERASEYGNNCI